MKNNNSKLQDTVEDYKNRILLYSDAIKFAVKDNGIPPNQIYVETLQRVTDDLKVELTEIIRKERKDKLKKLF